MNRRAFLMGAAALPALKVDPAPVETFVFESPMVFIPGRAIITGITSDVLFASAVGSIETWSAKDGPFDAI